MVSSPPPDEETTWVLTSDEALFNSFDSVIVLSGSTDAVLVMVDPPARGEPRDDREHTGSDPSGERGLHVVRHAGGNGRAPSHDPMPGY